MTTMTRFRITGVPALAVALMLGAGTMITGPSAQAQQRMQQAPAPQGMPMQPGMMGPGMGQGMPMQPGMMGQNMGQGMPMQPGMMGPGMMGQNMGQGMPTQPGQGQGMGPGMMGQGGMWHTGPHMMSPEEMHEMMEHMGGMMGPGMGMGQGMPMQPGMGRGLGPGMMGPGMMGPAMGPRIGGWSGLEGQRVVPAMQLSTDDVRAFFQRHLAALGNERLKVGKVEAMDDDTITTEVVTVDDSLVERFEVDRHTGMISPAG